MSDGAAKKVERRKFQAIRGTRDLLPPETALWNHVEQTARAVFATYGFGEIRLPIFEQTDLFARAVGGETDIVSKEMYTFEDARGDLFALRETIRNYVISLPSVNASGFGSYSFFLQLLREFADGVDLELSSAGEQQEGLPRQSYEHFRNGVAAFANLASSGSGNEEERIRLFRLLKLAAGGVLLGRWLSLRPEGTASVCRAYIEHNMQQLPQPVKLYYIGPMFRRERPQKGRYRQFYQIGAEVLEASRPEPARPEAAKGLAMEGTTDAAAGSSLATRHSPLATSKDAAIDAEVIDMLMTFFAKVGLAGAALDINSIGHAADNCRRGYVAKLRAALLEHKDQLGADSQRRIDSNPLRVLDSKLDFEQPIIEKLPRIADHLCDECKAHYTELKRQLDLRGVRYKESWRLVRGLDYYMRTTFEITAPGLGSQNAVCGGGRYDGLVELLGGPPTKGIGFAIGEDRLILSLQEAAKSSASDPANSPLATRHSPLLYIAWMGQSAYATAIRAAKTLRAAGLSVELPPSELKFGKALGQADKLGAKYALILGDNEVSTGEWTLKTLDDGTQRKVTEADLLKQL